jgi:hypothetical protein
MDGQPVEALRLKGQFQGSAPAEYIAKLEEPRRADVSGLDALIRKTAPKGGTPRQMRMIRHGVQVAEKL